MGVTKVNFTFPEEVVASLKAYVRPRGRSAFVAEAVRGKLRQLEQEQLRQTLIEGYTERSDEDRSVNREWEQATLEGWSS